MAAEKTLLPRWLTMMAAISDAQLHRSDLVVLGSILDRMGGKGFSYPSMTTIAKDTGVSRSQVVRVIPRLCSLGYLDLEKGNHEEANRYRVGSKGRSMDEPTPRRADEPTGGRTDAPTPRRVSEPSLGAQSDTRVGAPMSLESGKKAIREKESGKSNALTRVTKDAIEAFNRSELVTTNGGKLARVTEQGLATKSKWIKRSLETAKELSKEMQHDELGPAFWDAYFEEVSMDPWKRGDGPYTGGHENWRPSFEYLTRDSVMVSVWEGATARGEREDRDKRAGRQPDRLPNLRDML